MSEVINEFSGSGYTPDGSLFNGSYGYSGGGGGTVVPYSASAVAVSQAGSYTSGPSARAIIAGVGADTGGVFYGNALRSSWAGLWPCRGTDSAGEVWSSGRRGRSRRRFR